METMQLIIKLSESFIKLSKAQSRVFGLLSADKDGYCKASKLYDFQELIPPNTNQNTYERSYFKKPTLRVLIQKEILVETNKDEYKINPEIKVAICI